MKKLLLTLIVCFAMCGSIFAQDPWGDFDEGPFEVSDFVAAFVQIDGEFVTEEDNWEALEIAAFVDGQLRGRNFMVSYVEDGDPYPVIEIDIFRMDDELGGDVTFELYDHDNNVYYGLGTSNVSILTGQDFYSLYFDYDEAEILSFTSPEPPTPVCYTKEIEPYENVNVKDHYYLIASPVLDELLPNEVEGIDNGDYDLYYFDQTADEDGNEWYNYNLGDGNIADDFMIKPGVGYLYASSEYTELKFCGETMDITQDGAEYQFELKYDPEADEEMRGWNLLGNPFNATVYITDRDFYLMKANGSDLELISEVIENYRGIEAMEGFFVHGEYESDFVNVSTRSDQGKSAGLSLNLSNGRGVIDRAIVRFGEGRQLPKFQLNRNSTKVYIPQDNKELAVVRCEGMGEMPVNFKAENNGSYTLSFNSKDVNFTYLHLVDNMTGENINLLENPSYSFDARTTDYASRFKLVYATSDTANSDNFGFFSNDHLMILGLEGNATLKVMDITGRTLSTENFSGSYDKALNLSAGVYMLQLIQGSDVKTQKIVVR